MHSYCNILYQCIIIYSVCVVTHWKLHNHLLTHSKLVIVMSRWIHFSSSCLICWNLAGIWQLCSNRLILKKLLLNFHKLLLWKVILDHMEVDYESWSGLSIQSTINALWSFVHCIVNTIVYIVPISTSIEKCEDYTNTDHDYTLWLLYQFQLSSRKPRQIWSLQNTHMHTATCMHTSAHVL